MICLDIETTGFDPENDEIIEIAIVRFNEKKILAKWESLIDPGIEIPPIVTHITGIRAKDVENAPSWDKVGVKVQSMIENEIIVGHNISFDIGFLRAKGITVNNPHIDTYDLARILLTHEASYSLEILTSKFGIAQPKAHRAMDDVKANIELFHILEKKVQEIDPELLGTMVHLLQRTEWKTKIVFESALQKIGHQAIFETIKTNLSKETPTKTPTKKTKTVRPRAIKLEELLKVIPEYEPRDAQIQMARKVEETIAEGKGLICEAGTGTGKSLAYLLPAALRTLARNEKIVVSTHTKTLQDQLFEKDVPLLKKMLPADIKVVRLKGRKNYLSVDRLRKFMQKDNFQEHEITVLLKVLLWLEKTENGDLEELELHGKEQFTWYDMCCDEHYCFHENPQNECFFSSARHAAQDAHIIIANHALLLSDTIAPSRLLPEYSHLIIDEAHNFEDDTTYAYTLESQKNDFDWIFLQFMKTLDAAKINTDKASILHGQTAILFDLIDIFYKNETEYEFAAESPRGEYAPQLILEARQCATPDWKKINATIGSIEHDWSSLRDDIEIAEKNAKLEKDITGHLKKLSQKFAELKTVITVDDGRIRYIDALRNGTLIIKSAPVSIAETLCQTLFSETKSVVLTSATLSVADKRGKNFAYIRAQLGLDERFGELMLPSPFDYKKQAQILIPEDIPEQGVIGHFDAYTGAIQKAVEHFGGRTLVLFTSKKTVEAAYHKLAVPFKEIGVQLLAQDMTGGRGKILTIFQKNPESTVIFGTSSFWEGVDFKGEMLKCVIIHKMPFDRPKDPVIVAREKSYRDSFNDYRVPRAIIRFKQGFGRLIRSEKDTGIIILLDTRLLKRDYGERFLNSLPENTPIKKIRSAQITNYL